MSTIKITATAPFHSSRTINLRAKVVLGLPTLSADQQNRAKKELCGNHDCLCRIEYQSEDGREIELE